MHLFFDTVWKLHIGEIPEKPKKEDHATYLSYYPELFKYNEAIAAIKQNALPVGNPELIEKIIPLPIGMSYKKGHFYPFNGGYETKEIKDGEIRITAGGHPFLGSKTVAILTLLEEKKNTMENFKKFDLNEPHETTASGSVAAPKHSTCSDIPLPLEPTECREIRPAITWEEIRNLHKENEELKLFLEDIRRIAFNGFSYKDRIQDIQKKFPSR